MGLASLCSPIPPLKAGGAQLLFCLAGVEACLQTSAKQKKDARHNLTSCFQGWKMGFEPTTFGTTIRHSNQLSYIHHMICFQIGDKSNTDFCYFQISALVFSKIGLNLFFLLPSTDYPACSQPSSGARAKWHLGA